MIARVRLALVVVFLVTTACWLGCSKEQATPTLGDILPQDTLAWVHMEDLPALEGALERWGVMDLLVEKLGEHQAREDFQAALGIELAEDPRETIHMLMQELVRADVSGHAPLHEGADDPVYLVHLECVDEAAAERVLAMVKPHATGEVPIGEVTAMVITAQEEMQLLVGRVGAHVLMSDEAERFGQTVGDMASPPVAGLTGTEHYLALQDGHAHQLSVYITPDAQSEFRGLGPMAPGFNPASMGPIMEKYGSQYSLTMTDYLLSRIVSRQMLTEGSVLAPLYDNPSSSSKLLSWASEGTFFTETALVSDGRAKMELVQTLVKDIMATAAEGMGQDLPPMQQDPFAAVEGVLGFSLADLAERLAEWGVAGTADAGWQILMRANDEATADEILGMFTGSPAFGMLIPAEPITVGEVELLSYASPMDNSGKLNLMGRSGDVVMMIVMAEDQAAVEAYVTAAGKGTMLPGAPAHVQGALGHAGWGWGYVDVAGVLAFVGEDMEDELDDLPPALAARLRGLKLAGHMQTLEGGVQETVVELGQP